MRAFDLSALVSNPLLSREIRSRWRDGRSFSLVFALSAGLCLLFVWLYQSQSEIAPGAAPAAQWATTGQQLFRWLAVVQTLAWLLISPSLSSSSIAYERERGWFDSLLLSRLLPRQIALGKWAAALLFAALLYGVTLPFALLTLLMGGVSPADFWLALGLHALCAALGAAIGLAASAWSTRSHVALRTAHSMILVWLLTSLAAASIAGDGPLARVALSLLGPSKPSLLGWAWGLTNPLLVALELGLEAPQPRYGWCFAFLGAATLFFLWVATYYSRRALEEAPFIESRPKKGVEPAPTHGQIPLVTRLRFANPVLDREVRAKFRMRQPPLAVIIAEAILAILVAGFYFRTLWMVLFDPPSRFLVWWGLIFTGLIVSMMAAAVMGSNGFSREREAGTWEGIRLSLLSPAQVIGGKIGAPMLTCALFSLPVWPLLLPCIAWQTGFSVAPSRLIGPLQAAACLLIWAATAWSFSCIGLWIGQRHERSARAAGQSLGALAAFLIVSPVVLLSSDSQSMIHVLGAVHPFVALIMALSRANVAVVFLTGAPYFAFHLALGTFFLRQTLHNTRREFSNLLNTP